jgi:hypothetical protein
MGSRLDLQDVLEGLLGTSHVYFQPPETVKMEYPCIVYLRNTPKTLFGDNVQYLHYQGYQIMVIDKDPDSEIPEKVATLPLCMFERHYTVDNLNHDVYKLYY